MHVVECPSCSSLLKVSAPVSGARLKCRKCGVVFVGTSRPMSDPASAPAPTPAPAIPPMPYQRPATYRVARPQNNNNLIYVGIAAGVVLVALIVGIHAALREKKLPEPPAVVKAPEPPPPPPPPPPAPKSTLFSIEPDRRPSDPAPARPAVRAAPTPPTPQPPKPVPAGAVPPEKLPVECRIARIGLPGSELPFLQGSVRNDRGEGLKGVTVEVRLPDQGKQTVVTIECAYLAPRARVPFLVLSPVPLADGFVPEALAVKAQPLAPQQVCWAIEEAVVKGDDSSEVRTVTGTVRNLQNVYVSNIEVYADVYFADGRSAGPTIKGKLEHGDSLPPAGRDDFSLTFTPTSVGTRMQRPVVRVVGNVPITP